MAKNDFLWQLSNASIYDFEQHRIPRELFGLWFHKQNYHTSIFTEAWYRKEARLLRERGWWMFLVAFACGTLSYMTWQQGMAIYFFAGLGVASVAFLMLSLMSSWNACVFAKNCNTCPHDLYFINRAIKVRDLLGQDAHYASMTTWAMRLDSQLKEKALIAAPDTLTWKSGEEHSSERKKFDELFDLVHEFELAQLTREEYLKQGVEEYSQHNMRMMNLIKQNIERAAAVI
jgi:hypothetical protein